MALTDLTRVSTSGIATGTTLDNAILRKDISFKGDQVGINSALFDSSERRLDFKDNVKLRFGDSGDLSLSHNINDSVISHSAAATGALKILSGGAQSIECIKAGAVNISHNGSTKIETTSTGTVVTGVLTATSFSGPIVGHTHNTSGISTFYNLRVSNDLTVEGTTTTLDTNLVGVDRIEVGANSNTVVGVAITQSGTADIINLFDGSTEVLTVTDGGKIGIGTASPDRIIHAYESTNNNLLFLESGDTNVDIIQADTGGSTRIRNSQGSLVFYVNGDASSNSAANAVTGLTIDGDKDVHVYDDLFIPDKIVHEGDTNTAIRFPANDVISFERGGSEALRITTANALLTAGVTAEPLYPHYVTARKIQAEIKGAIDPGQTRHHGSLAVNCTNSNSFIGLTRSDNTQTDGTDIGVIGWTGFDGTDFHQAAAIMVKKGAGAGNDDQPGHMIFKTNSGTTSATEKLRITSTGQVLIGAGAIAAPKASVGGLDVASGLYSIIMGGEANTGDGTPRANSAQKEARLGMPHYTNAEEPFGLAYGVTISGENRLHLGGGSSIVNAATSIKFYTAANTTTTTGTERLRITAGGQTLFTGVSGTTPLDIKTSNSNNNTVQPLIEAYADNATYKAQIGLVREGSSGLLGWAFLTNAVGSPTEKLRIHSSGVVQIQDSTNATQGNAQLLVRKGAGGGAAPESITRVNSYMHLGGTEWGTNAAGVYMLSFGYTNGTTGTNVPAYIGFKETTTSSYTRGDLIIGLKEGTSDVAPVERLRIKSDGELLIGTGGVDRGVAGQGFNSGSGWSGGIQLERPNPSAANNSGNPWIALTAWNGANQSYTGGISFNRSNSNTQGTHGAVNTNQQLGNIAFNGSDGTNFIQGAEIYAIPDQTFATNDGPASLVFGTTPDGTGTQNPVERLRIDSVGTTRLKRSTISSTATTANNAALYLDVADTEGSSSSYHLIGFGYRAGVTNAKPAYIGYQSTTWSGHTYGDLVFGTRQNTTGTLEATERMRITRDGQIQMSNSNPPASGVLFVSDDGSATPITSGATARIANNGSSASYAIAEIQSGNASWDIRNSGDLYHKFAGRHGHTIGSTSGNGAYILLDGAANGDGAGSNYMYMEHASNGDFEMWNGNGSNTTSKFLDVTADGQVRTPKQVSFAAYRSQSTWAVANGDRMEFNATRHNVGNYFDTSTNVGRFTAPVTGLYQFNFYSIILSSYTNGYLQLFVNGARIKGGDIHFTISTSNWHNVAYSQVLYLTANQYVELFSYTGSSSGSVSWHGNNWQCFSGHLLG